MQLSSNAFSGGSAIPHRFTCDGEDLSPPLDWQAAPEMTASFVLLCDDPDAPSGTWHHWAVYDIDAAQTALAEGASHRSGAVQFKQAINDFHRVGYGGPARPAVTDVTAIIFVCWRCRSTTCRSARSPPAARSSEKHAGILSPKRPSSGSISDNLSPDYPTQVIRRLSKSMSNRADFDKTGPPGINSSQKRQRRKCRLL